MFDRPGKGTLTGALPTSGPAGLAIGKKSAMGAPSSPPPKAQQPPAKRAEPNAVIKVVAYSKGKPLGQPWGAKARWEGPLPQKYTGTRGAAGWTWDHPDAKTVRIGSDLNGQGGKSVEAWAGANADRIVIFAAALDAVSDAEEAAPDDHEPGHGTDARAGGDGPSSAPHVGAGQGQDDRGRHGPGHSAVGAPEGELGGTGELAAGDLGPSEADEKLADDFERALGIGPPSEDGAEVQAPGATNGTSSTQGRTGPDTRDGGTGPGGARARLGGDGEGSEDGGQGGTQDGSRDGGKDGAPDGMYGGEGQLGDGGVPSAVALFGGLISLPPALRGLVEVALIASSGDATGAGGQLFKRGLGKLASAVAARTMIAKEARIFAMQETTRAVERIAANKRTAEAWAKLSAAEQNQARRVIYWELQRKYFQGYLEAAKRAKTEAKAALKRAAPGAEQRLKQVELAEEAASAPPVAGQLPRNHEFAGKYFPRERLPTAFRQQGLRFTEAGYPDFSPYAKTLPNGKKSVDIVYTGSRSGDFAAANAKAGYKTTPPGYRWHHHQDMKTMQLVPSELHDAVTHTGGVATNKHSSGVLNYGK
jgi:A nuclease of the HNH/ENDO VII superfamily with conserved WHH